MVIIKQLFCYTCTLACVQSFFADHNKGNYTQSEIIYSFPDLCFVNDSKYRIGAFLLSRLPELGQRMGFEVTHFDFGYDFTTIPIGAKQTLFITTNRDDTGGDRWHTVRMKEIEGDKIWVMNPAHCIGSEIFAFDVWSRDTIKNRQCDFWLLTLK